MADHFDWLEDESIEILREVCATAANPVLMYSIGKDSSVPLHLALKAFAPAPLPFPLLHIDTTWKFRDMYRHRQRVVERSRARLIVHTNQEGLAAGVTPFTHGSDLLHRRDEDTGAQTGARRPRLRRHHRRRPPRRGAVAR